MKWTPGRLRILRLLCVDGAYALPSGRLVGADNDGRSAQLKPEWCQLLAHHGYIAQSRGPKNSGAIYVWTIAAPGRAIVAARGR